jgi:tetratricopeptide (TPR) repeat protein
VLLVLVLSSLAGCVSHEVNELNNEGYTLAREGKFDEAIELYDRAITLDSKVAVVWHNRGGALDQLSRFEEVLASYDTALDIDSSAAPTWNNRGLVLRQLGRYDEALESYKQAIEIYPRMESA